MAPAGACRHVSPMRPLAPLLPVALLLLAGCIAPPEGDEDVRPSAVPPPAEDRIDGMTAQVTQQKDQKVDCGGSPGVCYERDLLVTGRIGLDELPIELDGSNGAITVTAGPGDAWSLHATVRVRAPTDEEAREGLDEAWTWSHEESGAHALKAGPKPTGPVSLPIPLLPGATPATVVAARYEVVMHAWVVLAIAADSSNGPIAITGVSTSSIDVDTSNGAILLRADVEDVTAQTSNGAIEAFLRPTGSGTLAFETSNGQVHLGLVEDAAHGYDLAADTSNGRVSILLRDGDLDQDKTSAAFRTNGYSERRIRSEVSIDTSNGAITVTG